MEKKNHTDIHQKEKINYQSQMLHYGLYMPRQKPYFFRDIAWHWHDAFEIGYVCGGSMLYKTNQHEFILHEGDGIFVNSGILHSLHPIKPLENVRLQVQFFDKEFLSGSLGSIYDIKYLTPVQEQKNLDAVPLYRHCPENHFFLEKIKEAASLGIKREPFFEMRLRTIFSQLWEIIYGWAMDKYHKNETYNSLEDERIKQTVTYIQKHFPEKIKISELASLVHISERECYRLFQNTLGMTPTEFILSIRLQRAQDLLINTDKSILDIAAETGFGTSSYFGKIFKQHHQTTPLAYRHFRSLGTADHCRLHQQAELCT